MSATKKTKEIEEVTPAPEAALKKRGRKPKSEAEAPAAATAVEAVSEQPKKRGRKPKSEAEVSSSDAVTNAAPAEKPAKAPRKTKKTAAPEIHPFRKAVDSARENAAASKPAADFAAQVTLSGAYEGVFYVKSADGKVDVQPYDYKGADLYVTVDYDLFVKLLSEKADIIDAAAKGLIEMKDAPLSTIASFCKVIFK